MVEWAFDEYFKTGTFPPKPADLTKLIRQKRESMHASNEYQKPSQDEMEGLAASRKAFFTSPEYKNFVQSFDKKAGVIQISPARRQELKNQASQIAQRSK
jgi:hypothetical protein